jgi:hypothetical protein
MNLVGDDEGFKAINEEIEPPIKSKGVLGKFMDLVHYAFEQEFFLLGLDAELNRR